MPFGKKTNMAEKRERLTCNKTRLKRFKPCRTRVHTKSTSGKKITRNVRLREENFCRREEGTVGKTSPCEKTCFRLRILIRPIMWKLLGKMGLQSTFRDVLRGIIVGKKCANHSYFLELKRKFFSSDTMWIECCNSSAVCRCMDCGPRQYFCMDCASALHEKRNYFNVLETFKVSIYPARLRTVMYEAMKFT